MGTDGEKDIVIKGRADQMAAGVYLEQKSRMQENNVCFFLLTLADQKLQYYTSVLASTYRSNNRIKTEIASFYALKKIPLPRII